MLKSYKYIYFIFIIIFINLLVSCTNENKTEVNINNGNSPSLTDDIEKTGTPENTSTNSDVNSDEIETTENEKFSGSVETNTKENVNPKTPHKTVFNTPEQTKYELGKNSVSIVVPNENEKYSSNEIIEVNVEVIAFTNFDYIQVLLVDENNKIVKASEKGNYFGDTNIFEGTKVNRKFSLNHTIPGKYKLTAVISSENQTGMFGNENKPLYSKYIGIIVN